MTISVLNHASATAAGSASAVVTIPSTTAGSTLLLAISTPVSGQTVTSVKFGGTNADNWTQVYTPPAGFYPFVWMDKNCAGSQTSVTIALSGSDDPQADYFEVAGLGTTPAVDQSSYTQVSGGAAAWTSGASPATTAAAEFVLGVMAGFNNTGATPTVTGPSSGGWVNQTTLNAAAGLYQKSGYLITAATGAQTYAGTSSMTSPNQFSNTLVVSFTGAAAGITLSETVTGTGHWGDIALRFSGSNGTGAHISATNVPNIAITTTQANSAIAVIALDWNGADGTSRVWETVNAITPAAGNGFELAYALDTGNYTAYAAYYPDAGAAGSKTVGLTAPAGTRISIAAIEILGTTGVTVTVSPAVLPAMTQGSPVTQALSSSGGTGPYTYSVTAGSVPAGTSLTSGGVFSGTPTASGAYSFTVTSADSASHTGTAAYSGTITASGIAVGPASLPGGAVGAAYSQAETASGGTGPYTYAVTSGALPDGLSLNTSTGVISGTPVRGATYNFTITVTDSA